MTTLIQILFAFYSGILSPCPVENGTDCMADAYLAGTGPNDSGLVCGLTMFENGNWLVIPPN